MTGHRRAAAFAAVVLAAGCAGAGAHAGDDPSDAAPATAPVTRQDLTVRDELAGTLGYRGAVPLVAGRAGTVTWMPAPGTVVRRGEVIAEIDGAATRLLFGDRPAWRRMAAGERPGPDMRQLNDNLAALGYAERPALPDDRFDWRTGDAVSRWQRDLGLPRTGAVEFGDVTFLRSEARVAGVEAPPGAWVDTGQALATATGTAQVVTVDVDAARRSSLAVGSAVAVVLPDRTTVGATVGSIGRVASAPAAPDQRPTVTVEIDLPGLAVDLDAAPVVVAVERVLAEDVLTVPVGALVARAGGGYAVERVTAAGTELVPVQPGQFAHGLVEVTGDVDGADAVVVPS